MLIFRFTVFLNLTSAISSATISAANVVPRSDLQLLSMNATTVGNIDPRFSLTFQFDDPLLSTIPCLMNAVWAVQELALGNFTDHIEPATYALPDYPTVSVVTEATTTSDTIERRFLIWGIWKGIFYMMRKEMFQNALFTLYRDGAAIGYVIFAKSVVQSISTGTNINHGLSQRSAAIFPPSSLTPNITTLAITRSADGHQLKVGLTLTGQALTMYEIFITILSGMAYVAELPNSQKVDNFSLSPATFDTTLSINDCPAHTSTKSLALEAQWVIMALGFVPRYMVERLDFREVVLKLEVDGQRIGQGFIERGRTQESSPPGSWPIQKEVYPKRCIVSAS